MLDASELDHLDHRRGATAAAIQQCDHLRHLGDRHPTRADGAGDAADQDADDDEHAGVGARLDQAAAPDENERGHDREGHADRGELVAAPRAPRVAQELEADDEEDRRGQVGDVGEELGIHDFLPSLFFDLNISSMRSVTTNPPNRLAEPSTTAAKPIHLSSGSPCACASTSMPPSITMPWMALVPDMSGVWSCTGTFEITSKPTKTASMKM